MDKIYYLSAFSFIIVITCKLNFLFPFWLQSHLFFILPLVKSLEGFFDHLRMEGSKGVVPYWVVERKT